MNNIWMRDFVIQFVFFIVLFHNLIQIHGIITFRTILQADATPYTEISGNYFDCVNKWSFGNQEDCNQTALDIELQRIEKSYPNPKKIPPHEFKNAGKHLCKLNYTACIGGYCCCPCFYDPGECRLNPTNLKQNLSIICDKEIKDYLEILPFDSYDNDSMSYVSSTQGSGSTTQQYNSSQGSDSTTQQYNSSQGSDSTQISTQVFSIQNFTSTQACSSSPAIHYTFTTTESTNSTFLTINHVIVNAAIAVVSFCLFT